MATLHNEAKKDDIAKIVLTSGDPKRCEYIAKTYLSDVKLVNSVRGMTAYTGYYKDKKITVFPVGMGMPSMGIYAYELYRFYDVEVIIRMGTCGSINKEMDLLDTILLDGSYTEGNFALMMNRDNETHLVYADSDLNSLIEKTSLENGVELKRGMGICNDFFDVYLEENKFRDMLSKLPQDIDFVGMEMEAFALFYIARLFNKKAACLLTLVDLRYQPEKVVDSQVRATKLDDMIKLALETTLKL